MLDAFFLNTDHDTLDFYEGPADNTLQARKIMRQARATKKPRQQLINSRNTAITAMSSGKNLRREIVGTTSRRADKPQHSSFQSIVQRCKSNTVETNSDCKPRVADSLLSMQ